MERKILVTGGSGNLGQAVIERFVGMGDQVIATFSPGRVKSKQGIAVYEADLTNEESVDQTVERIILEHKKIDAAVLTVGGYAVGKVAETNGDVIRRMINLNFDTSYFIARKIFLQMEKQQGGKIIFIGSRPALNPKEGKNALAYALSKSMVLKLAELLNAEGNDKNIVCSVIVPGVINTQENRASNPSANYNDWVTPETIADAIEYLISERGNALREPVLKLYSNS